MEMSRKPLLALAAAVLMIFPLLGISFPSSPNGPLSDQFPPDSTKKGKYGKWSRAMLDSMTLDEKIGQLFMVAAYSNKDEAHNAYIEKLVTKEGVGGLIFMQGGPGRQVGLANRFQTAAKLPLLIAQDSEWGLSMRLDSTQRFPKNMTLGAIRDSMAIFELGMEIGRQCRAVGVQVNFAPVVDVNNNPNNPVINDRSYGENPQNVAVKGLYFYKGMEYAGCVGTAKHFPGHGDTDTDSHLDLPVIDHPRARLDSTELYPFKYMFERGVAGVMVAHLYIPALDTTKNLASTLSPKIVTDLLKKEMGFKGLIFTDALGMKGVTKFWADGETDLKALMAGNDVLLFTKDVPKAKAMIKQAVKDGKISEKEIDRHVLKILVTKEWAGLHKQRTIPSPVMAEVNSPEGFALQKRLYQEAMTLVQNRGDLLPLNNLSRRKIAVVEVGVSEPSDFYKTLQKYASVDRFSLPASGTTTQRDALVKSLKGYNTVVIGVDGMSKRSSKGYGLSTATKTLPAQLKAQGAQVALVLFGSPYSLKYFGVAEDAILVAYEDQDAAKVAAAEAVMGGIRVDGVLPVTASKAFQEGSSIVRDKEFRFSFGVPEAAGMDGATLLRIDSIANAAVAMGATPGCAVLVMRGDKIVFDKGFGRTEYGKAGVPVDPMGTIYDLASVTKVAATTITTMKLVQEGLIDPEEHVSAYLQDFRERNLTHIRVKNLLLHNAGFRSWIPFYRETFDSTGALRADVYSQTSTDTFCVRVVDDLWMCTDYQDSIWLKIVSSTVKKDGKVRYSDLSMMVMQKVIESVTGTSLDAYVDSVFYKPMGMNSTAFVAAERLKGRTFAPTENDTYWRKQKLEGYVHDQASAMLGGVSGHAGLFSNVYDLAKVLMMVKNGGRYGEMQYFSDSLVKKFTSKALPDSRKAMGWDRPEANGGGPCSGYASEFTFGHTGFTGIGVWVDPQYDLVFIFLSNRTYPDANNKILIRENIRPEIQSVIYESIFAYEGKNAKE